MQPNPKQAPPGACISCQQASTTTGLFFDGWFENHVTLHTILGIPKGQAVWSTMLAYRQGGAALFGQRLTGHYTLCRACAKRAKLPPPSRKGKSGLVYTMRSGRPEAENSPGEPTH